MKIKFLTATLAALLLFTAGSLGLAAKELEEGDVDMGKTLFDANCASCHNLDVKVTGPALRGVLDRWDGDIEQMSLFIKNSQTYIKGSFPKSSYAKDLYAEYNNTVMTAQALSNDQIIDVLAYIQNAPAPPEPAGGGGEEAGGGVAPESIYSTFSALVGIVLIACLLLVLGIAAAGHALRQKNKGEAISFDGFGDSIRGFFSNRVVGVITTVVILLIVFNGAHSFLWSLNLHDGYQPVQPVAFSHKLHAGAAEDGGNAIDCKYCHTGVEKGKSATIPGTNTCMNCHNVVDKGPKHGEDEINKVQAAWESGKPIEWVRIHNLPDFVYFSHAQHVKVAGLECQECHGPVEEMEEVYQHSRLSMGWCINCHREKEVDLNKSEYYKTVHQKVAEAKQAGELDKVTVSTLGGTECARCHY